MPSLVAGVKQQLLLRFNQFMNTLKLFPLASERAHAWLLLLQRAQRGPLEDVLIQQLNHRLNPFRFVNRRARLRAGKTMICAAAFWSLSKRSA